MKTAARKGFFGRTGRRTFSMLVLAAATATGCGRTDLGFVRGMVVSAGAPRGFALPEMMNVTFSMNEAKIPRAYTTPVRADGTFSVDMNNGSGKGIPYGSYVVAIDTNNLLMRGGAAAKAAAEDEGNEYPRPAADVLQKLRKATCTVEIAAGKGLSLVIDLDAGTIAQEGSH